MMDDLERVSRGMTVTEDRWESMRSANAARRIHPGNGVRVARLPWGTIVSAAPAALPWAHSWKVRRSGDTGLVAPGRVNGLPARIDDTPLEGDARTGEIPRLRLRTDRFSEAGESWVALRLELEQGRAALSEPLDGDGEWPLTIVQTPTLSPEGGAAEFAGGGSPDKDGVALYPLAVFYRGARTEGFGVLHQIAHFDLNHRFSGGPPPRHFFWAA